MTTPEVDTQRAVSPEPSLKSPAFKPLLFMAVGALALTMAASIWIYVHGTRELRAQAKAQGIYLYVEGANSAGQTTPVSEGQSPKPGPMHEGKVPRLLKQMDDWALRVTLVTAAGGAGLMLVTILGINWWRRAWLAWAARTTQVLHEDTLKVRQVNNELQKQIGERKRLELEIQRLNGEIDKRVTERTAVLNKTYSQLEEELNERKQAEKALAQQAQELERSKDVLELHVQARTQELQKLQRRNEHILNSAGEGIYGLDLHGRTTFVNPAAAKLTGWKVEELVGKNERDVFTRNHPGNTTLLKRSGASPAPEGHGEAAAVFHRKDGSTFLAEYIKTAIMEKEKVVGAVVIFKDITERKRTEETLARKAAELARSNAELEQFAYVASHDLQEPLRKIQAFGDRLKTKCDAVQLKEGRDYLDRMQSAAARMQTLINDLLSYSRVISTTQPFVPVDLGVVTKEVLTDLEVRIEQTKAKVEIGSLPTIEADPLQMRQLLQNLVGNALKFQAPNTPPLIKINGRIMQPSAAPVPAAKEGQSTIENEQQTTDSSEALCELTIQDNGIGFDEKYSEKIFAVFQRLHGRTEYEGTGVGLAVCRRITDRHGGTIHAKSKPGEGATFIVTLPVKRVAAVLPFPQAEGKGAGDADHSSNNPHVQTSSERLAA